jgi:pectate lyase
MSIKHHLIAAILSGAAFAAGATITVTGTRDFGGASVGTSCDGDNESQQPVILVKDGGVVKNVTITAGAAADGIHCEGNCTLQNVTWADVCEDAATMKGGSGKKMTITGGSSKNANDKTFQHNGVGSNVTITNFTVNGSNGKLYRACGNCSSQGKRTVNISNVTINGSLSSGLAGINKNYGDVATIRSIRWKNWNSSSTSDANAACITFTGVLKGQGESPKIGPEWGTTNCNVQKSDITKF